MLRYAYFHDFKSGPKLLIWGGPEGMAQLFEALAMMAQGEGPEALTDIPGCISVDGTTVLLETVGEPEGLERDPVEPELFHWREDPDTWFLYQELVEPLMHGCGHQVLPCAADGEIVVMVSCGEYSTDLKPF